jgi:hypothetical protein
MWAQELFHRFRAPTGCKQSFCLRHEADLERTHQNQILDHLSSYEFAVMPVPSRQKCRTGGHVVLVIGTKLPSEIVVHLPLLISSHRSLLMLRITSGTPSVCGLVNQTAGTIAQHPQNQLTYDNGRKNTSAAQAAPVLEATEALLSTDRVVYTMRTLLPARRSVKW